ncbi:MAG TPA: phosphoribosylamine--glycine ligase [Bacteroidota bacterium]|nr:phosphoribosylamine--glycine ligase [Bacteroidota bacterium]
MNILVIGSGAREHAILWKLAQSVKKPKLYCAPGNAGTSQVATNVSIKANDLNGLLKFAKEKEVALTIAGPEQPLVDGIADLFRTNGLAFFGPSQEAAALEGSKIFAKEFMERNDIPTAPFRSFDATQFKQAKEHLLAQPDAPIVLKADGLAAGKGVVVASGRDEAVAALEDMMQKKIHGRAGERIVIEECLAGEEVSILALTDGRDFVTLVPSQDHKRIFDGDKGKNTGGMGAYAPMPRISEDMLEEIETKIIAPVIEGMSQEGRTYTGCLYAGLMLTGYGPKVIEFNCRFGDPETEVVLPLLDDDLLEIMLETSHGTLSHANAKMKEATAACVVLASGGYPDAYETGKKISGLEEVRADSDTIVFHAGTKTENGSVVTAGGRVLAVTSTAPGNNLEAAIAAAYRSVDKISFQGMQYRKDIGKKGILNKVNH